MQQRTALISRIRGLLSEQGIVLPLKAATVRHQASPHLEDLPGWCNTVVGDMLSELARLDERIKTYDQYIDQAAKQGTQARQLMRLGGVGAVTASAIVASVGKGHDFVCGRQERASVLGDVAAWGGFQDAGMSCSGSAEFLDVDVTV